MKIPLFWAVGLVFALGQGPLVAEETEFSVRAEINKARVTIGERMEYKITVTHDPSVKILSSISPPSSDIFEIKEVHEFSEKQANQIVEGRSFTLSLFELGEFILDPVAIRYQTSEGKEKSVETDRLYVTVESVDQSGKQRQDIRGAKTTLVLPRTWGWVAVALFVLAASGGGVLSWLRCQRKRLSGSREEEPTLSLEDEALLRLNRLFDSELIRKGKVKEYFLELSQILRSYLERRFDILAIESTTSEILLDLRNRGIAGELVNKIGEVLDLSDLVKFAKLRPSPFEIMEINQHSGQIIEDARPKIEAEAGPLETSSHGV